MTSQRKNSLNITKQSLGTLELIKNQVFSKFNSLMNEKEAKEAIKTGFFNSELMPFPFIFAPKELEGLEPKSGDTIDLLFEQNLVGRIYVSSVYQMKDEYKKNIFSAGAVKQPELGNIAVSGEFEIFLNDVANAKLQIESIKKEQNAQTITALMLTADPFNRAHERIIRMTIDKADLVIIFLLQSYEDTHISFELRRSVLEFFIQNYLPQKRVVVIPFKNTNLFSSHQNPNLECIAAHRLGANKLVIGQNHSGIGMFFDQNKAHTMLDEATKELNMQIVILPELVYCNQCKTLVSTKTCPHGGHHHIKYHPHTIKELLFSGIMPPAILMRPDISAFILSKIFPNRFKNVQKLCDDLFPNIGLIEPRSDQDFYKELMKLYQTSSMT
ncbi:sulfate adenylyltransferase [Campylobacter mucosalis]|uniref:sulfate adenylyltransferase n=1 Tax=Campylobacter mucosalis TaxID=202 RepID=UPI00147066A6|nr:sulfate adenylyltransferase [Campylobacter mucosalis]